LLGSLFSFPAIVVVCFASLLK